jgi:diguanylate cyclase (GGDEF)-like protein
MPKRHRHRRPAKTIRFSGSDGLPDVAHRFATLLVVQGAEVDLGSQVVCDRPVTIGRDEDIELPLRDGSISRRHCRVERTDDGAYLLSDLGSTNGTRLNGAKIQEPTGLSEGDKIFLGSTVVKFGWSDVLDAAYHARLEALAATDGLTGLLSSRKFDAAFAQALVEARDAGAALGVLVMDMDGLKQVNDAHGHQMGAFALTEVAAVVRAEIEGGAVCRFGGDEFVAYVPGLDRKAAVALAERVRAAVAAKLLSRDGVELNVTLSIGVAAFPDDGASPESLFRAADQALYRAKAAGKNRVSL